MDRAVLALLLFWPHPAWADDPPATAKPDSLTGEAAKKPPTPSDEFEAIRKDYDTRQKDVLRAYVAAKTDADKRKELEKFPKPAAYTGRMMALAEKYPTDPAALEALLWTVKNGDDTPEAPRAATILVRDHFTSDKLADICAHLASPNVPGADQVLQTLREKSPHRSVRGQATFALGQLLMIEANQANHLAPAEVEHLYRRAEALFDEVVASFADGKHYRGDLKKAAQAELFQIHQLPVGKAAPEIDGEDVEGKKFKLSEYRGKVVLLDFWGHW